MRKKTLIEQNAQLFGELQNANKKVKELTEQIEEQKNDIEELKAKIESGAVGEIEPENRTPIENLNKRVSQNVMLNNETEYAAKAIGRIVYSASDVTVKLEGESGAKEKINLVLGKSEVAKCEIMDVLDSEETRESKKIRIDEIESQAKDYFEGILAQRM